MFFPHDCAPIEKIDYPVTQPGHYSAFFPTMRTLLFDWIDTYMKRLLNIPS